MKKIIINGMSCGHCVNHVKEALMEIQGVEEVKVDLETKIAEISGDVADSVIKEAIEEVGYEVVSIE